MAAPAEYDPVPTTVTKEMTATLAEFLRCLTRAAGAEPLQTEGDRHVIGFGDKRIEIDVTEGAARRIALMTLPVLHVRLTFFGYAVDDIPARLAVFDQAFQRGGG